MQRRSTKMAKDIKDQRSCEESIYRQIERSQKEGVKDMILKYSGVTESMLEYADSQLFEIQRPEESTQPSVMFGTEYEFNRPVE